MAKGNTTRNKLGVDIVGTKEGAKALCNNFN